ncbi:beta strand repeat-containing protein [Mesorhizobium newzealandense]|uniref:Beta strand repeat-containing protein n=1 Tax=Mesorhizobium newzealandense TaxID=1300302 RepID=A0ABW4UFA0_9HYPH
MTISFILNAQAVNDQTTGLQTGDNIDDAFTDTDVAYSTLPASFRTYLESTLGLNSAFPTSVGVATKTNSVTVNATAGSQLVGTTFTDGSGGTLNGDDSGLNTLGGKDILLFAGANDTVIGKYDSDGNGSADAIAFVIFKQDVINAGATSDQVTFNIVTYVPIFHGGNPNPDDAVDLGNTLKLAASETLNFGFAGAPSGSNLFMTFGDPNSTQIVVIGKDPLNQSEGGNFNTKDVLNISQAGGTTSFGVNGNAINPTEGAFITYVSGANTNFLVPNLDQNEADVEANIDFQNVVSATGASFTVNQTNPGKGPVTVKITAFSTAAEPGAGFVDGLTNDTKVNITSGSVVNFVVSGESTPVATVNADGTLTITGLTSGDKVQWTTGGTHDRVLIENISNADGVAGNDNNTFDIGGFGIVTSNSASAFVGQQIVIEDDGPTAGIVQGAPTVAHDETAGTQADADDTTAPAVVALFAGVSNVSSDLSPAGFAQDASAVVSSTGSATGTDGGTTAFSLAVSAAGVDSGLDTTAGTSIFLFKEGDLVVGRIGGAAGAAAFAVAINSTTGIVSVAQYASLKHPGTANPDDSVSITDSALLAVVTVTDGDGDTATSSTGIGDAVQFQDDGPTAGIVQGAPTVAHDETAGNQADADDTTAAGVIALFAGVGNVSTDLSPTGFAQDASAVVSSTGSSFGADQEGGTTAFSLAVSAAGVDSGLDTTAGTSIFLFKEGDLVVGRIGGAAGAAAFAVAINGTTGIVSVAQYASLKHPGTANPDDSVSITDSALLAVVTVTDGDGDTATSSTGIGDAVQFQDDGPTAGIVQGAPTVAHDETAGNQADADDTTAAGVIALFAGVSNVSSDLSPAGFAQDASAVVSSTGSATGTDGGTTAFSLAVSAAGVDSGLDTTAGTSIFLFKEGDLVVGRIGGAAGAAAFAVAINGTTGIVSVAQYASLKHPGTANPDDSVSITDSALLAVVTVTDGDGDTATSSTGIGDAVQFQDDGPTAGIAQGAPTVAHDETAGNQADADDTTAAGVIALFAGVSNVSSDLSPTGFAQDASAVVSSTGSSFGADQEGGTTAFSLAVSAAGVDSGLDTTAGTSIFLFKEGDLVVGRIGGAAGAAAFAVAINGTSGVVSVAQYASLKHPGTANPDDSVSITDSALLAVVTVTDGDGDTATSSTGIGDAVQFQDDGPTAGIAQGAPTVAHDETAGNQADADDTTAAGVIALFAGVANVSTDLSPTGFAQDASAVVSSTGSSFGADQEGGTTAFSLAVSAAGVDSGLDTTAGTSIFLFKEGDLVVGRIGGAAGAAAFAVAINSTSGIVSVAQYTSILHPTPGANHDEPVNITDSALLAVVTVTDGDGDTATSSTGIGDAVHFQDDGPTIVDQDAAAGIQGFDGDPGTAGAQHEQLHNVVGVAATGVFSFDIGNDGRVYDATHSDFGDADPVTNGVQQLVLTGTVDNAQNPNITNISTSLTSESATSAVFAFSFHYDKDPITAGVQDGTAGGTLTFNKELGTYSIVLNDVVDGFSFSVFHSSELLSKAPPGNTGHPELVVTELDKFGATPGDTDGFYVQFTANSNPSGSPFGFNGTGDDTPTPGDPPAPLDTTFNNGQFVTSAFEDWVSATQSTNGVAGDTIQKGELLTLRFFNENIMGDVNPGAPGGGDEKVAPTDAVDAVAIKFDGIGNSEDLIVVLDLIDYGANGVLGGGDDLKTTKSIYVQNADFFKGNTVPAPYSSEFTLDQNDALVIIESNDYNAGSEHYQIQGMQIMQSGNGLSGSAINLNRVTDDPSTGTVEGSSTGAASGTGGGALQDWEGTDNDVLKITDIGFIESTSGQIGAHLNFAVNIQDGDGDTTGVQTLVVDTIA